ncbi:MAG TPA: threonine/serine dehydratase [Vicinamibacterales bacterium]|nr:threonine/serine dehydratase [Vicinamibacterales bacterium]
MIDVLHARRRIAPYVLRTPLVRSAWLSDLAGASVWLKPESLQRSNAFKARGAFNAVIARLERPGGPPAQLVTASAGNHGRGLAAAARTFNLPLVVFTPADAPKAKLDAIQRDGADLRPDGRDYDEAERMAKAFAKQTGAEFISPYSDADVIDGAATVALEMFEDQPDLDTLVVPIGGGGLISGMATVARAINPSCEVIGVELEVSNAFQQSVAAGRLVEIVPGATLADGLGGNPDPETITFALIQRLVDRIVTVSEADLVAAVIGLVEAEHLIAEGAGAAATAALIGKRIDVRGRRVGVVVSGGNIDRARLAALLS